MTIGKPTDTVDESLDIARSSKISARLRYCVITSRESGGRLTIDNWKRGSCMFA